MKLIGINISGDFTILGYFKRGYMIPYNIIQENISIWQSKRLNKSVSAWSGNIVNHFKLNNQKNVRTPYIFSFDKHNLFSSS